MHKLKNRHLRMIALGGVIGTGLFFGSAKTIQMTGPSIILAYILSGLVVYIIMRALGEMTVANPNSGSFSEYANKYIGKYAGFISGWSAWFEYTVVCMVELTAVTIFIDYFYPGIPHWIICFVILVIFTGINLLSIRLFGEFEFWFAGIKVCAIIAMLIFSAYLIFFKHSLNPQIGEYANSSILFAGGLKGFIASLVIVVFSFGGTEFVTIAAGESEDPNQTVPKAINGTIFRILIFYILTMTAIIALYPFTQLSNNISPFVDVFKKIGLTYAAGVMNLVAITAALSAFNSCLYSASRMVFSLGCNGHAPKGLSKISPKRHIPQKAVIFTSSSVLIAVLVNYLFPNKAIMYLLTIATSTILIVWFMVLVTQIYFRKHMIVNKKELKYRLYLYPFANIIAIIYLIIVMFIMLDMDDLRMSVYVAPLWILGLSMIYAIKRKPH